MSKYTKNRTTVVKYLIYNGTTAGCSVLRGEVNRVSACTKSNNRSHLYNSLLIMLESKSNMSITIIYRLINNGLSFWYLVL